MKKNPSPGNLPDSSVKPGCPILQADSLPSEPPGNPSKKHIKSFLDLLAQIECKKHFAQGQREKGKGKIKCQSQNFRSYKRDG